MHPSVPQIGISGFASYIPQYRVKLADWCKWTGDNWDKVRAVVGSGFRMRGPNENAYTMAATAVLRLITQYQIDPQRIGQIVHDGVPRPADIQVQLLVAGVAGEVYGVSATPDPSDSP